MTINKDPLLNQTLLNTLSNVKEVVQNPQTFATELQRELIDTLKAKPTEEQTQTDASLEEFKRQLSSMGALNFLQNFNLDKIEAELEKKKAELMDSLGLSKTTEPPLSGEDRKTALSTLDKLLSDYKKELLEKMTLSSKASGQSTVVLGSLLQRL